MSNLFKLSVAFPGFFLLGVKNISNNFLFYCIDDKYMILVTTLENIILKFLLIFICTMKQEVLIDKSYNLKCNECLYILFMFRR